MAQYRDSIPIITLRSAASSIAPRVWRNLESVVLTFGIHRVEVALRRVIPSKGAVKSPRVWFVCPNPSCGALAGALAFSWDADVLIGCRKCLRWRSRSYRVSAKAPHVGPVKATAALDR
jgi:hypothetical protein